MYFSKRIPPHKRLHKHYLQLLLEPLSCLRETKNEGDTKGFFLGGGGGKQGVLWEMRKWRIGESRRGENGYERRSTTGRGTRDAKRESRRRRGVTFDSVLFYDRELTGTFSQAMFGQNESLEKLSITFTSNGKRECVPRDQVSSLLVVYCSLFLHLN